MIKIKSFHLCNYLFNYPLYINNVKSNFDKIFQINNERSLADLQSIRDNMKAIAMRDWKLEENKSNKASALVREFDFQSQQDALIFMNLLKTKCDEMDHHPEWTLQSNGVQNQSLLKVTLSTHDKGNSVTFKDYELAAIMSYNYEEKEFYKFKYNRTVHY
jgi:pterin-4a-carbinolamine dehydratase